MSYRWAIRVVLIIGAGVVATSLPLALRTCRGRLRSGYDFRRYSPESVRLSWGTPSGFGIGPALTLRYEACCFVLEDQERLPNGTALPELAPWDGVWMYRVDARSAWPAYVNPLLKDTEDRIDEIIDLAASGRDEAVTRLAAQSFIYLGWVVLDEQDAKLLSEALSARASVPLDQDIVTPTRTLYRLRYGVEARLAANPADPAELRSLRGKIPVMFESMNTGAGHPGHFMHVLFLDGHVERIRWGERFPAVPAFMAAFPPAPLR